MAIRPGSKKKQTNVAVTTYSKDRVFASHIKANGQMFVHLHLRGATVATGSGLDIKAAYAALAETVAGIRAELAELEAFLLKTAKTGEFQNLNLKVADVPPKPTPKPEIEIDPFEGCEPEVDPFEL